MFKKRIIKGDQNKLEVIKVRYETREVEESSTEYFGFGGHKNTTKTTSKVNVTIVLAVKDGELVTREFNGKWDLSDVKKWEELGG